MLERRGPSPDRLDDLFVAATLLLAFRALHLWLRPLSERVEVVIGWLHSSRKPAPPAFKIALHTGEDVGLRGARQPLERVDL